MSSSDVNIEDLTREELVRLQLQISRRIAKEQTNADKEHGEIKLRTAVINIRVDSDMDAEIKNSNQPLKKPPVHRMSCPPPPPPVNKSIADKVISPRFTRSISTESIVVPVPKPRTKLEVKPNKPPIAPKPVMLNDNLQKLRGINQEDLVLPKRIEVFNRSGVTHANQVLNSRLVEEFKRLRVVEECCGTLKRVKPKNDPRNDELYSENFTEKSRRINELRRQILTPNSKRPLPELPPTPVPRKSQFDGSSTKELINRLSVISNKALDNLEEDTSYYSEDSMYKTENDYADDEDEDYEEPIYAYITESVYGPKPQEPKPTNDYQENDVFNTLKRSKPTDNIDTPPPLPPKPMLLPIYGANGRRSDGETESETSSIYSGNARGCSFARESIYFPVYPPREGSGMDDFDVCEITHRKYNEALDRINQSEKIYIEQLEKISNIHTEHIGKADDDYMKELFGDIKGLTAFHKNFFDGFKSCHTLPQLGKLVIKMENDFDIYQRDQWCKVSTKTPVSKQSTIFMPYQNWAENHLSMYRHLLNQLLDDGDPDLKVASTIISELMRQCEAIHWLKDITNFPKLQEAGKFLIKDKFEVTVNSMKRGNCDVIFMEKYILCVSTESQDCFFHLNTSKISVAKKGPKALFIENIFKDKKLKLKSNDPHVIETWYNRYLCLIHKKSDSS